MGATTILIQLVAWFVAATLGWSQTRPIGSIITDLSADELEVRRAAREELVKVGLPAVQPLLAFIARENGEAMYSAVEAGVAAINNPTQAGQQMQKARRHDENLAQAFQVLSRIGKPSVESLLTNLKEGDPGALRYKALVIESLGDIGDKRAIRPIITAMRQYGRVGGLINATGEHAAKALQKLTGQRFGTDIKEWEDWWAVTKPK